MTKLTYSKTLKHHGSTQRFINVERDGLPFGQLWTWPTTRTETHPWHAKPLNGEHKSFYAAEGGLAAAKAYLESHA